VQDDTVGDDTAVDDAVQGGQADDSMAWEIESSRLVVRDRWLSLRADRCISPSGVVIDPYYVQEPADWVSVFALDTARRVLLVREYHHGARIVAPGLPGGAAEPGESSPAAAAARELVEETGYEAGELHELGSCWANWNSQTNLVHFFLALDCEPTGVTRFDASEDVRLTLVPLAEFRADSLDQGYHRLTAFMALDRLRSIG
jgi:ADP-ribose pyrophosphatase